MSARNIYHDAVVHALTAEGWTITDDPLKVSYGGQDLYVDLGAERVMIGAEKGQERIAVEVASFLNPSLVYDLHAAVGQYDIYRSVLAESEPDRPLYLAVPERVYENLLTTKFGLFITEKLQLRLLVFDHEKEKVLRWTN